MSRNLVLIGGIAAFFLIAIMCLRHSPAAIEDDIRTRATQQFDEADLRWARVAVDGRDVRLSGLAPDSAARDRAVDIANSLVGVRVVNNRVLTIDERVAEQLPPANSTTGEAPAPAAPDMTRSTEGMDEFDKLFADLPYGLRMKRTGGRVTIEGTMPEQRMIDELDRLARERFGDDAVSLSVQVRPGAPPNWLQAASASLTLLEGVDPGNVGISNEYVMIEGIARTDVIAERLRGRATNGLPPGYIGTADIAVGAGLDDLLRTNPGLAQRLSENERPAPAAPPTPKPEPKPDPIFADEAPPPTSSPSLQTPAPAAEAPAAPAIQPLSASACQRQIDAVVARRSIRFETASDVIDEASHAQLDEIAAIAVRCIDARVEIAGHTDDQGTLANNLNLSQRRAESVMAYLVSSGVRLSRLTARGYGEEQPLVPNETADARAINRRIEFNVRGQ
ncbi:MAG: OmpA family protein [Pseudomonadota bacterium]